MARKLEGGGVGRSTTKEILRWVRADCTPREKTLLRQIGVVRAWLACLYKQRGKGLDEQVRSVVNCSLQAFRPGSPLLKAFHEEQKGIR